MRDLGDYQTPPALVAAVLDRLGPVGNRWPRVLEPTCGRGHFLAGLLGRDPAPRELVGVEIQPEHLASACSALDPLAGAAQVRLIASNLFDLDLARDLAWRQDGPLLVVGNPPWITTAALGTLGSTNQPARLRVPGIRGIEALTGASNFDMAEAVWLKILTELAAERPTVALLGKTTVARRVLEQAQRRGIAVASAELARIDARAWFGVAVDAGLLRVTLGTAPVSVSVPMPLPRVALHDRLGAAEPVSAMGWVHGRFVADLDAYAPFAACDGHCPLTWRQGIKHDAAAVMELTEDARGVFWNRLGERVAIELEYRFPLLKAMDLGTAAALATPPQPRRWVIVTQQVMGAETDTLRARAPRLWAYLQRHASAFAARRSSVYRGRPPFTMFGIGPYTFSPFKVVVSGLHKSPRFHAIGPAHGRPVVLDDTCYALACASAEQAALLAALLNRPAAVGLLRSLSLAGAKRPITQTNLRRLDLAVLLQQAEESALLDQAAGEVVRLLGRDPCWPTDLGALLRPEPTRRPEILASSALEFA